MQYKVLVLTTSFIVMTFFLAIISLFFIYSENIVSGLAAVEKNSSGTNIAKDLLTLNQDSNKSSDLELHLHDLLKNCSSYFTCEQTNIYKLNNSQALQLTTKETNQRWSWIFGDIINVAANQIYKLVTHMKLNEWATQSHVALEGYNETSKLWYQLIQCPSGIDGPFEWREFSCNIIIPNNTTKIRAVLNAGWSSESNKKAKSWFGSININKLGSFVNDDNLKSEIVYEGLEFPTDMAFLGPNDFLVLEQTKGTVQRIVNGEKLKEPLIDLNVAEHDGLLGIATYKNISTSQIGTNNETNYVFLYFTESHKDGGEALGNRLYRYELVNNTLIKPKLLLDLPIGRQHFGGKILIGPDNYLYLSVGEVQNLVDLANERNSALNNKSIYASEPDGRGGILRIDQNGKAIQSHGILGDKEPLNEYFAYGIRNGYGMDFDPLTEKLWDTENGPSFGDEINLVEPGFNSGWRQIQGVWTVVDGEKKGEEIKGNLAPERPQNLVDFGGKGNYSSPEFTWDHPVGPTALKFLTTDKLGEKYQNDIFVADANNGRIYHFKMNQNRTGLLLEGPNVDKVANSNTELSDLVFSQFDGTITDMEIGPDKYLYIVGYVSGKIYRILAT